jgi:hypothetical protein
MNRRLGLRARQADDGPVDAPLVMIESFGDPSSKALKLVRPGFGPGLKPLVHL